MALSDLDLYNWLLSDILKVQPTGDPVNDAIYLVLLPMVVLYMYINKVVGGSRFLGNKKIEAIIMFIMGFFIIREGYYPMFAAFSIPLLIIIMLWHTASFVFGRPNKGGSAATTSGKHGTQPGTDFDSEDAGLINKALNADKVIKRGLQNAEQKMKNLQEDKGQKAIEILEELEKDMIACNKSRNDIKKSLGSGRPVLGDPFSGVNSEETRIKDDALSAMSLGGLDKDDLKRVAPTVARKLGYL